ncbi:MAG TPA: hypothetical protein VFS76_12910 [Pyrinomonadaceae bacterium]|nr:hypothetical protein [Pyrinomonadaceae bacterium]
MRKRINPNHPGDDTIVVASEGRADPPLRFGAAYIFRRTPSGWHQQKKITTDEVVVDGRRYVAGWLVDKVFTVAVCGRRLLLRILTTAALTLARGAAS